MIAYNCPRTLKVIFPSGKECLVCDSMENNLIPPFILREEIHWREEMTEDVHTIQDLESGLFIPLSLQGTFSVFNSRKPTDDDIRVGEPVFITPEGSLWNPHCESFADNEASLINYRGEVLASSYRYKDILKSDEFPSINPVLERSKLMTDQARMV